MNKNQFLKSKKVKYGAATSAITALFIVAVVCLNLIMSALSDKVTTSVDLTSNKAFKLTDDSKKFISSLNQDVEIVVLNSEDKFESVDQYFSQANKVIKQYSQSSDKIKVSYVDTTKNPTYLSAYKDEQVTANSVIVKNSDKYKILSVYDLFDIQQANVRGGAKIVASKAESTITSAILYVTGGTQTKIALIKGYSESEMETQGLTSLLTNNNFEVVEVSILSEDLPSDASAAVILGPARDLDDRGIEKINKFMDNNGEHKKNLLIAASSGLQNYEKINTVLETYGVKIGSGQVFETDSSKLLSLYPVHFVSSYSDDEYTQGLKDSTIPVYTPLSLPIEIVDNENVSSLLETSSKSGIVPLDADDSWKITQDKLTGPITTAAVSSKNDSKVFVMGSCDMFDSEIISQTSLNNASYILNVFKKMRAESDTAADINIEPISLESKELGINVMQSNLLMILFMFVIPILVLVIGVVVVVVRKDRAKA